MLTVNAASGFGSKINIIPDATISFTASAVSTADAESYTFSSVAIGTAAGNRTIAVATFTYSSTSDVTALTVGGVSASQTLTLRSSNFDCGIWEVDLASGTTADIVVTSPNGTRCGIGVWALYSVGSVSDTATDNSGSLSQALTIPVGGVAIGVGWNHNNQAPNASWTNLTERYDEVVDYTSHTGADSSTAGSPTISVSWTITHVQGMCLAAWPKG